MNSNPYQPGMPASAEIKTRATAWMIWVGISMLLIAVIGLIAIVSGLVSTFDAAAASASATSSDLASGINNAVIPSLAVVLLTVIGIALIILGFVRRQPVTTTQH